MGGTEHEFRKRLKTMFAKVKTEKPDASRKQSTEGFFVAVGYRHLKEDITTEITAENTDEKIDKTILPQDGL